MAESELSTEQLIEQFQNGNDRAFASIVERLLPMVRCETVAMRCNQSDGDDLAQEALLGLLSAAQNYSPDRGASFMTYARVCVRRRLLNAVSALASPETPHADERLFDEIERDGAVVDPGDWLLSKEEDEILFQRLKSVLSDLEYRVLMYHLAAYTYDEIAVALGVSSKSVDNALQRIRRKLAPIA